MPILLLPKRAFPGLVFWDILFLEEFECLIKPFSFHNIYIDKFYTPYFSPFIVLTQSYTRIRSLLFYHNITYNQAIFIALQHLKCNTFNFKMQPPYLPIYKTMENKKRGTTFLFFVLLYPSVLWYTPGIWGA